MEREDNTTTSGGDGAAAVQGGDTQARPIQEHLEKFLSCAVCLDTLKEPKILPCQHTFCANPCLKNLLDADSRILRCPECRQRYQLSAGGLDELPTHRLVMNLLDITQGLPTGATTNAVNPGDNAVTSGPQKKKCLSCHKEEPSEGEVAEGGGLKLSKCMHCSITVCEDCKVMHMNQLKFDVTKMVSQIRRSLPLVSENITTLEVSAQEKQLSMDEVRREVEQSMEEARRRLKEREKAHVKELDSLKEGSLRSVRLLQDSAEADLASLSSFCEMMDSTLKEKARTNTTPEQPVDDNNSRCAPVTEADLLSFRHQCQDHLKTIQQHKTGSARLTRREPVTYRVDSNALFEAIRRYGTIVPERSERRSSPSPTRPSWRESRGREERRIRERRSVSPQEAAANRTAMPRRAGSLEPPTNDGSSPRQLNGLQQRLPTLPPVRQGLPANSPPQVGYRGETVRATEAAYQEYRASVQGHVGTNVRRGINPPWATDRDGFGLDLDSAENPPSNNTNNNNMGRGEDSVIMLGAGQPQDRRDTSFDDFSRSLSNVASGLDPRGGFLEWDLGIFPPGINATRGLANTRDALPNPYDRPLPVLGYTPPVSGPRQDERRSEVSTGPPRGSDVQDVRRHALRAAVERRRNQATNSRPVHQGSGPESRSTQGSISHGQSEIENSTGSQGDELDDSMTLSFQYSQAHSSVLAHPAIHYRLKGSPYKVFGEQGITPGALSWPRGLAISPVNDAIAVADTVNHRVQLFDREGEFVFSFGSHGSEQGQLDCPVGVTITPQGLIAVSDRHNHRIQLFDAYGEFESSFGEEGSGTGQLREPWGIACSHADGDQHRASARSGSGSEPTTLLYVCDRGNNRIQVFDLEGRAVRSIGEEGTGDGQLQQPTYVCVSMRNQVFVSDHENHRVQVFNTDGVFQRSIGMQGRGIGQLNHPTGIAVDGQDFILVADSGNSRVQVFRSDGRHYISFGGWGSGMGQVKVMEGLALNLAGKVVVVDRDNHRVQMF